MLLNQNAKTEKSGADTLILGLELLPHRLPFIILSDKRENGGLPGILSAMVRTGDSWGLSGKPTEKELGKALSAFARKLASGDETAWKRLEAYSACPGSSQACRDSCLVFSGFGTLPTTIQKRLARSLAFIADERLFCKALKREICDRQIKAEKKGLQLAVRLNVFSDHRWEKIDPSIFESGSGKVIFYDYTKLRPSARKERPSNYYLTQSWTDTDTEERLSERLSAGNLAVPFFTGKEGNLPSHYMGRPVIDGDISDDRFRDPSGSIVGLRVKGKAGSRPLSGEFGVSLS